MEFKAVAIIVQRVEVDFWMLHKLPYCIGMFVLHCYGQGSHSIVHVILLVHLEHCCSKQMATHRECNTKIRIVQMTCTSGFEHMASRSKTLFLNAA